jgi:hypothetical protein
METVLVCVAPEADFELYELLQRQLRGPAWEAYVVPVTDVENVELPPLAGAVALVTDWPDEQVQDWLAALRRAIGLRVRILALLPRPPESYPAETQRLWNKAFGYGAKISAAVAIVNEFVDERR